MKFKSQGDVTFRRAPRSSKYDKLFTIVDQMKPGDVYEITDSKLPDGLAGEEITTARERIASAIRNAGDRFQHRLRVRVTINERVAIECLAD